MTALARWCHAHRLAVILLWAAALLGLGAATLAHPAGYSSDFALPNTDSTQADTLLTEAFPAQSGDTATLVWHTAHGTVHAAAVTERIDTALAALARNPAVSAVSAPQDNPDATTAYADLTLNDAVNPLSTAQINTLIATARAADSPGLDVQLGGDAIENAEQSPPAYSEIIGIAAAAVVLFLALGALTAMALPILTAIAGVGTGLLTVGQLSHTLAVADFAPTLGALIGLGVGIDYALFIVTRYRCGLRSGLTVGRAVEKAGDTSGRAVLFAGATVCVALLGMLVLGLNFLDGVALAATITVAATVLAALTLLPATLGYVGTRALRPADRRALAAGQLPHQTHGTEDKHGRWRRWAGAVERRPRTMSLVALAVMAALAIPVLSLRLGSADAGNDPAGTTTRQAYDLLADGFGPGFNGPLILVTQTPAATADAARSAAEITAANAATHADNAALTRLADSLSHTPGVASVIPGASSADGRVHVLDVIPSASPQSGQTAQLITTLREHVIPAAEAGTGLQTHVGGTTATYADFAAVLTGKLPLFVALIAALGFLLLVIAFRCLVVPATAALMNLLAAAASLGVVTAFFEWGWGSDRLGMGGAGPVEAFLPVMMLAILFGLSMDYQVFLVSRMHEEWVNHGDNARAVKLGQVETSRVITAAATIMICVFCAFAFGSQRVIGEFGIGLATAVTLDAFVLRTLLVPAVMHLFGAANWWLPAWLDRILPRLHVEAPAKAPEPQPAALLPAPVPVPVPVPVPRCEPGHVPAA